MAVITAHSFNTSQTEFRTSQSQQNGTFSYSESALTQLPSIDFDFDDLRRRMNEFTTKFDAYIERGRKRVFEERNDFRARLSELNEDRKSTATQIDTIKSTLASHSHILSREAHEKSEMQTQIASLEQHAAAQRSQRDKLHHAIASTQRQIDAKLAVQREYAEKIDQQAALNGPELTFWETYLGTRIEGGGDENIIRVIYSFPAERGGKEAREATFELHVPESGSGGYEVVHTRPKLNVESVARVVRRLNETRDIAVLLKGMRGLFQAELGERMTVR